MRYPHTEPSRVIAKRSTTFVDITLPRYATKGPALCPVPGMTKARSGSLVDSPVLTMAGSTASMDDLRAP